MLKKCRVRTPTFIPPLRQTHATEKDTAIRSQLLYSLRPRNGTEKLIKQGMLDALFIGILKMTIKSIREGPDSQVEEVSFCLVRVGQFHVTALQKPREERLGKNYNFEGTQKHMERSKVSN